MSDLSKYAPLCVSLLYAILSSQSTLIGVLILKFNGVDSGKANELGLGYGFLSAVVGGVLNPLYAIVYCQSIIVASWSAYLTVLLLLPLFVSIAVALSVRSHDFGRRRFRSIRLETALSGLQVLVVLITIFATWRGA